MIYILMFVLGILFIRKGTPLKYLSSSDLIRSEGYTCEIHEIHTTDGYILEIHRIPPKVHKPNLKPVLLAHGLLFSSSMYVINGRNSFAFYLADLGYDVWMFNHRGNSISRKHEKLDYTKDRKEFFNYTLHEIATYDLTATIDYVLERTGFKKLNYVGYSQGGTIMYIMNSMKQEYNEKISIAIMVATTSIMRNVYNLWIKVLSSIWAPIEGFCDEMKIYTVPGLSTFRRFFIRFSDPGWIRDWITLPLHCKTFMTQHVDESLLPKLYYYFPTPPSMKQLFHYSQFIKTGKFRQYDYRKEENLKRYNSEEPPTYNLKNITVPIAMYFSDSDTIATEKDMQIVSSLLPNVIYYKNVPSYQHADFFNGVDQIEDLYKDFIQFLENY
ncbi:gastric triacylglycerol lipase [Aethina tumida]|uniref:gastric triacylglycerol lipase n=1 Tax=Aethina tumida TaxID=116153 RepID=UPI00096B67AD|nr:gastric triacylglycerol lipase [Aethina tumida]